MEPTPPPTEQPTQDGGSPLRTALSALFWALFLVSQVRGCEAGERLKRVEQEQKQINAKLVELQMRLK